MTARISSQRYAVEDFQQALDLCYSRGWTDGLPVVPPTEPAVRAMLDAVGLEPDAQIAFITNRQVAITAEKVAINAVMAGCLPEHMPVVVAALEGIADPRWGYHGPGHVHRERGGPHHRERAHREAARLQLGRQPLRAGLARRTPPSGARCAW